MKITKTTIEILSGLADSGVSIDINDGFIVLRWKNHERYIFESPNINDHLQDFHNFVLRKQN